MKYIIVCTISMLAFKLNAQTNFYKDSLQVKRYNDSLLNSLKKDGYSFKRLNDSYFLQNNKDPKKRLYFFNTSKIYYGGVVRLPKSTLTFLDKINNMNIYKATPDNMYIISPDSTLRQN